MTTYTTTPQDDSNLDVTVTEGAVTTINLQIASLSGGGGAVDSVNGQTGVVVLDTDDIAQGTTNLYYSDALTDAYLQSGGVTAINFENATTLTWNSDDGTLEFPVNADVTLQIGQENLIHVKNQSGTTLTNGTVVYVTGASGSKLTIDRADSALEGTSAATIAVMTQELGNNAVGYATTQGLVRGLNTSAYAEGAAIYLNSNGAFSTTKPLTPNHLVPVGWVVRSHATEGSIYVHINNGQELEELHDVLITNVQDGQGIVWDSANGYWKNATITVDLTSVGSSIVPDTNITYDLGTATNRWRDLYLSGSSIDLGGALITSDAGAITLPAGSSIGGTAISTFDGAYSSLTGAPTVVSAFTNDAGYATVAYVDSQAHFSGDYNDLINKPVIPSNVSELNNDSGYITSTLGESIELNGNSLLNNGVELLRPNGEALEIQAEAFGDWLRFYSNNGPYAGAHKYGVAQSEAAGFAAYLSWQTDNSNRILDIKAVQNPADPFDSGVHDIEYWLYGNQVKLFARDQSVSGQVPLFIQASDINTEAGSYNFNNTGNDYTRFTGNEVHFERPAAALDPYTQVAAFWRANDGAPVDDTQWAVNFGYLDDVGTQYKAATIGGRYDTVNGHEVKLQNFNPNNELEYNNLTLHETRIYSDRPFVMTPFTTLERNDLTGFTGMVVYNTDDSELQVWDGGWNSIGGGGGASALNDLTDVSINVGLLGDGDILRYNGTAGEWQNTNLGISVSPAISIGAEITANVENVFTITNYGDYDDPNIWAQLLDSGDNVVVTNAQMTDNGDGTVTFTGPVEGTGYKLQVRVQDFGDLASETVEQTVNSVGFGGNFRYWRLANATYIPTQTHMMMDELSLFTGAGQTGTKWPTSAMTSATTPSPFVVSSSYYYNTYQDWEMFDNISYQLGWWNLSSPNPEGVDWCQIDLGQSVDISSVQLVGRGNYAPKTIDLYASNTGAFAGEETYICTFTFAKDSTAAEYINIG